MTETEIYLSGYQKIQQEKQDLRNTLESFTRRLERAREQPNMAVQYDKARNKKPALTSPVERAVVLIVDDLSEQVDEIKRQLADASYRMRRIETVVGDAGLTEREWEYVRLRYFDGRAVQGVAHRTHQSVSTLERIRRSALEKIEKAKEKGA